MVVTASMVKELRERTGAGMMECKKALVESGGDLEAAVDTLRKSGAAKAEKKAGRIAAEGCVRIASGDERTALVLEVNSETDFVAKDENFRNFATAVADCALQAQPADLDALLAAELDSGEAVETARQQLVAKIGENITVRRFRRIEAQGDRLGRYVHGNQKIAVLVDVADGDEQLAKDLAMHIAANRPVCVVEEQVPTELLDRERAIFEAQAAESGKPPQIVEKIVAGRIKKYIKEVTLTGQAFVKDPDQTVGDLLKAQGATVHGFVRYEVGEGIEKKQEDFAEEVMAQVRGA
jgi:elongation factor Ts